MYVSGTRRRSHMLSAYKVELWLTLPLIHSNSKLWSLTDTVKRLSFSFKGTTNKTPINTCLSKLVFRDEIRNYAQLANSCSNAFFKNSALCTLFDCTKLLPSPHCAAAKSNKHSAAPALPAARQTQQWRLATTAGYRCFYLSDNGRITREQREAHLYGSKVNVLFTCWCLYGS
ncbi:unnamed protein product [Ceratitis capitata]|uniref:(Mediterranean fruit fly) hypothetical protein n=1 Tax=Ceratitis capitata TaxID=7213 RepID=A0A811UJH1_CERCA|nr:unnamed protein product [Ceratitis capitata]